MGLRVWATQPGLEHHLYPQVPHHNWPELGRRLDPYFAQAGVRPVRLFF